MAKKAARGGRTQGADDSNKTRIVSIGRWYRKLQGRTDRELDEQAAAFQREWEERRARWRADYGVELPTNVDQWERLLSRAGLSPQEISDALGDIPDIDLIINQVEGYLDRVRVDSGRVDPKPKDAHQPGEASTDQAFGAAGTFVVPSGDTPAHTSGHSSAVESGRKSHFVPSTDPRATSCPAWKTLMQFRRELLANPRQESGTCGWWSNWFGKTCKVLCGGGEWGVGYYGPTYPLTTPACATALSEAKGNRARLMGKDQQKGAKCAAGDMQCSILFLPNATYFHSGFVIDWAQPFPSLNDRGRIIEWVESWIDLVTHVEVIGRYPWEAEPQVALSPTQLQELGKKAVEAVAPELIDRAATSAAEKVVRVFGGGIDGAAASKVFPPVAEAIDEYDVALLAFLNRSPSLRRKVSDVLPDKGPQDRKAVGKRLRKLADRTPSLVDYPKDGRLGVAILPAGVEALKRATAPPTR